MSPTTTSNAIECDQIGLRYEADQPILTDVTLSLATGSFYFLTGASGAGKSSLLRILSLSTRPQQGQLTLLGNETSTISPEALPAFRRRIGFVFQDFRLLPHLSVLENIALPLKVANVDKPTRLNHAQEMLDWIGLGAYGQVLPETLSGGQKQRIAIARAVIAKPDIILADEPTGNLDPEMSDKCMYLLKALNKQGVTVVVATHDEPMVKRMGFQEYRLKDGKVRKITRRKKKDAEAK